MRADLYSYDSYRRYLLDLFASDDFTRGARAKLAKSLGCGNSFISQVLGGKNHFSLEQGLNAANFIGLDSLDSHFFLLLIEYERAGTQELRRHFLAHINSLREQRNSIQDRISVRASLNGNDQMVYYSSWIYAAIHILISIPQFRSRKAIAEKLQIPVKHVADALDFLVSVGLAKLQGTSFAIGKRRIHLGKNSQILHKHHANWRIQALKSIDRDLPKSLHFSSVMALSAKDAEAIKSILLQSIAQTEKVLADAREESGFCLGIDFFEIA